MDRDKVKEAIAQIEQGLAVLRAASKEERGKIPIVIAANQAVAHDEGRALGTRMVGVGPALLRGIGSGHVVHVFGDEDALPQETRDELRVREAYGVEVVRHA